MKKYIIFITLALLGTLSHIDASFLNISRQNILGALSGVVMTDLVAANWSEVSYKGLIMIGAAYMACNTANAYLHEDEMFNFKNNNIVENLKFCLGISLLYSPLFHTKSFALGLVGGVLLLAYQNKPYC